jgi:hypothetical protein
MTNGLTTGSKPIVGGCLCEAVRFSAAQEPRDVHYCHCSMCRKATGGIFATLAWFDGSAVRWAGADPRLFQSSAIAVRGACPICGTPLFLRYKESADIAIMVGALDDPARFRPSHHYGAENRIAWVDIDEGLPARPTDPDPRP